MTFSDEGSGMKRDSEVLLIRRERAKGRTQEQAAARAGMSVRTLRRYERRGKLPSQFQEPAPISPGRVRSPMTGPGSPANSSVIQPCRARPFRAPEGTPPWSLPESSVTHAASSDRRLAGSIRSRPRGHLFSNPRTWRSGQSDFTHMNSLGVTLGGVPFPHLVFHLVLVYSNVEAIQICFSESYESLVEGFETCLWRVGGVPRQHRTDHLSAAIRPLDVDGRAQAK